MGGETCSRPLSSVPVASGGLGWPVDDLLCPGSSHWLPCVCLSVSVSKFLPSFFFFFFFSGLHMEVPGLGVKLELEPLAYTTATATQNLSHICNLHHSSRQSWILNPLSEATDRICILMDTRRTLSCYATTGTPQISPFTEDAVILDKGPC